MKKKIAIIILLDLLLTWAVLSCSIYDDFDLAKALSRWIRNPTAETRAELDHQEDISRIKGWIFMGSAYCVVIGLTVPFVVMSERRKSRRRAEQK